MADTWDYPKQSCIAVIARRTSARGILFEKDIDCAAALVVTPDRQFSGRL
jgi:hypothetical protein